MTDHAHAPELNEDVDLDMERRRYILDAYAQLDRINHYALLGVNRAADKKSVKDAYFRLAGLVHPARYLDGSAQPNHFRFKRSLRKDLAARFANREDLALSH